MQRQAHGAEHALTHHNARGELHDGEGDHECGEDVAHAHRPALDRDHLRGQRPVNIDLPERRNNTINKHRNNNKKPHCDEVVPAQNQLNKRLQRNIYACICTRTRTRTQEQKKRSFCRYRNDLMPLYRRISNFENAGTGRMEIGPSPAASFQSFL